MSGNLPPGESLTFGSLTFVTDGAGWFYIKPPSFPGHTTFFGSLRFVIDRYGDLRLRVPPAYLAVGVLLSEPMSPIPPASGFGDDDLALTYLATEVRILALSLKRCIDLTTKNQPALASYLIFATLASLPENGDEDTVASIIFV